MTPRPLDIAHPNTASDTASSVPAETPPKARPMLHDAPAAVRERPILFSAPMVRAILSGSKTQTRRVVKPQPPSEWNPLPEMVEIHAWVKGHEGDELDPDRVLGLGFCNDEGLEGRVCPYGQPGERLWVRETFTEFVGHHVMDGKRWAYAANCRESDSDGERIRQDYIRAGYPYRWKPSIHMPRAACRIVLEITDVRVERLQAISEADCLAEGIEVPRSPDGSPLLRLTGKNPPTRFVDLAGAAFPDKVVRAYYASLWCDINGAGAWDANPWVWALAFRRVTPLARASTSIATSATSAPRTLPTTSRATIASGRWP